MSSLVYYMPQSEEVTRYFKNSSIQDAEESLLFAIDWITDTAYEKFTYGQMSSEQLNSIYLDLQKWTNEGHRLINKMG